MRYGELLAVLRGRRPSELLTPPAPAGYVWARVQQLADSSCMQVGAWVRVQLPCMAACLPACAW